MAALIRRTSFKLHSLCNKFNNAVILSNYISSRRAFRTSHLNANDTVKVNFRSLKDNSIRTLEAKVGDSFLDNVLDNELDLDGYGACEGVMACSTCHLVFKKENYDSLPETPCEEELDMLDLAYGLTDTSRLGCQVQVTKDMDGWEVQVPAGTSDARSL